MKLIYDLFKYNGHLPINSGMQGFIYFFTQIISLLFVLLYFHQIIYLLVGTFKHHKIINKVYKLHNIGIVISARNESKVIANLIESIYSNTYPQTMIKIFVIADNCTDNTAEICRNLGCVVFERNDKNKIGKGYALNYFFTKLHTEEQYKDLIPEAYIILDADNIIKSNFIEEMNKVYDSGYELVTSYRNSKNFDKNWITSGYGYWFLHESRHLNNCRMLFKTSAALSGTGFLVSTPKIKEFNNWEFFTLTEDIQCSTFYAIKGGKVGYCSTAELYDEQPETFKQSWIQRERWAKGFYQVLGKHGFGLIKNSFNNFSCWDIFTTIFPALIIVLATITILPACCLISICMQNYTNALFALSSLGFTLLWMFGTMFIIALLICITEWKKIKCKWYKKILYLFTFPIFMFTYVPISLVAMFKKVTWKHIEHKSDIKIKDIDKI